MPHWRKKNAETEEYTEVSPTPILSGHFDFRGDVRSICERLILVLGPNTVMEDMRVQFVVAGEGVSE